MSVSVPEIARKLLLGGALTVPLVAQADEMWTGGFGQGVFEASVTHGAGNSISVTCNEGGNPYVGTGIRFTLAGADPTGSYVILTFDGDNPTRISIWDGEIVSDCRACAGTYEYVVSRLRQHRWVHVMFENGDGARFSLRGADAAIVECTADFWR